MLVKKKITLVFAVLANISNAPASLTGPGMFLRDPDGARSSEALRELCDVSTTVSCRLIFATGMFVQANTGVTLDDVAAEFRPSNFTVGLNFLVDPFEGVLHTMRSIQKAPRARFSVARVHAERVLNTIAFPLGAANSVVQESSPYNLAFMNEDERRLSSAEGVIAGGRCDAPMDMYVHDVRAGKGTTVFIVGDDVNIDHDDFARTTRRAYDSPAPAQTCSAWHGTHVAGVVGGRVHGIAKETNIVPVPVARDAEKLFVPLTMRGDYSG